MKTKGVLIALAATVLVSPAAMGGFVQPAPVMLDLVARTASGDMVTARFSDNDFTFIGCGVRTVLLGDGSLFRFGFCQAGIAETESFTCFTENAALVDRMSEGSDFSFITFGWNEDGECTRVGFSTQSFYVPEFKDKKKK